MAVQSLVNRGDEVRNLMLSVESLTALLQAIIHCDEDRALGIIRATAGDEEAKRALEECVVERDTPEARLRGIGDVLRAVGAGRHLANESYRAAFYAGSAWIDLMDNPFFIMFSANKAGKPVDKWLHYFAIYDKHLSRFRNKEARVLEIGVYKGGGQQMLRGYLGSKSFIMGIDIDEAAKRAAGDDYVVEVGDQEDPVFLGRLVETYGPFDVVIDDGGHSVDQQIASVEALFPSLADGGVYLVEDCHTSYWTDDQQFTSSKNPGRTFIDWTKDRIDDINAYHHSRSVNLPPWTTHVDGLHVYDSVVVLEKQARYAPFCEVAGAGLSLMQTREMTALSLAAMSEVESDEATAERPVSEAYVAALAASRNDAVARVSQLEGDSAELTLLRSEVSSLRDQLRASEARLEANWATLDEVQASRSWKLTAPLRRTIDFFRSR